MTKRGLPQKVLVTGATGFIGSHLTRKLIEKGFRVGIVKRERSEVWRIKNLLKRVKSYNVSLEDTDGVRQAVDNFRPDVIFHLAASYAVEHQSRQIPAMFDTNVKGAMNLLETAKEYSVKLFVNTSSCFVYKPNSKRLTEKSPLKPYNLYALTKIHAEQACTYYSDTYGLACVTFRIFPPYGPLDNDRRLIPYIIRSLLNKETPKLTAGKQQWDFVYVDDIVEAYLKLLSRPVYKKGHEIFNIGTGQVASVRSIGLRLNEILGGSSCWGKMAERKNEAKRICADIRKAKTVLRWEPRVCIFDEGLRRTIASYQNNEVRERRHEK